MSLYIKRINTDTVFKSDLLGAGIMELGRGDDVCQIDHAACAIAHTSTTYSYEKSLLPPNPHIYEVKLNLRFSQLVSCWGRSFHSAALLVYNLFYIYFI